MKSKIVMLMAVMMIVGIAQANLVPNAGFEDGVGVLPDAWTIETGEAKITWSDEANSGSKSMLVTGTGGKPEAVVVSTDLIPVTAGTEYVFSACVKSLNGGTASGTNLRVRWNDAAGVGIGGGWSNFSWYGVAAGADWAEVTALTMEAPAGAVTLDHAWLYSWKGDAGDGAYVDDVSVTAVPEPMTLCLLGLGGLMLRRKKA